LEQKVNRAPPFSVREKNLLEVKNCILDKNYKTAQEVIEGCKAAAGLMLEDFSLKTSDLLYSEHSWSTSHYLPDNLIYKTKFIKIRLNFETNQDLKYYLKFFSRRQLVGRFFIQADLSLKNQYGSLCRIFSSGFQEAISPVSISLYKNHISNSSLDCYLDFVIPIEEYPEIKRSINEHQNLLLKKQEIDNEVGRFNQEFYNKNMSAALISDIRYLKVDSRAKRVINLINKLDKERIKLHSELSSLKESIINDYTKDDIQAIKSKFSQEEESKLTSLQKSLFRK
jgi:hypothetical protein